jgi:hypothetical protein
MPLLSFKFQLWPKNTLWLVVWNFVTCQTIQQAKVRVVGRTFSQSVWGVNHVVRTWLALKTELWLAVCSAWITNQPLSTSTTSLASGLCWLLESTTGNPKSTTVTVASRELRMETSSDVACTSTVSESHERSFGGLRFWRPILHI